MFEGSQPFFFTHDQVAFYVLNPGLLHGNGKTV